MLGLWERFRKGLVLFVKILNRKMYWLAPVFGNRKNTSNGRRFAKWVSCFQSCDQSGERVLPNSCPFFLHFLFTFFLAVTIYFLLLTFSLFWLGLQGFARLLFLVINKFWVLHCWKEGRARFTYHSDNQDAQGEVLCKILRENFLYLFVICRNK